MSMVDASQEIEWGSISGEVNATGQTAIRIPQSLDAVAMFVQPQFDLGDGVRIWAQRGRDNVWMICFNVIPPTLGKISWLAVPPGMPTPSLG